MSGCFEARLRAEGRLRPPHAAQRPSRIVTGAPSKLGMAFLTRIAPTRNLNRFYVVRVIPTLFGEWAVARGWGRRGSPGTVRLTSYRQRGRRALGRLIRRRGAANRAGAAPLAGAHRSARAAFPLKHSS